MAFFQPTYTLGLFTLLVFLSILFLERFERRFWCKNLFPLGALLGLCSRRSLLIRQPGKLCTDCRQCVSDCRMNAVSDTELKQNECIECLDRTDYCPQQRVRFVLKGPRRQSLDLSRLELLVSASAGLLMAPVAAIAPRSDKLNPYLIRPPAAVDEAEFLRHCVRCEEHCPTAEKAIVFEEQLVIVAGQTRQLKILTVLADKCIGCGICETRCPLEGAGAIRVVNEIESRRLRSLVEKRSGYG